MAIDQLSAEDRERGDDMVLTMLRRGCQAIRDLGTLELIGLSGYRLNRPAR